MDTQKLYRAVSQGEYIDWKSFSIFRTAINTLEAKQFFKSMFAVKDFVFHSVLQKYTPPYSKILEIEIINTCLENISLHITELDRLEAITINEEDLPDFNKCVKFVKEYEI